MQSSIGWNNLLKGFFSYQWGILLTSSGDKESKLKRTPDQFMAKLIVVLWTAQYEFWLSYQEMRHKSSTVPTAIIHKRDELQDDVRNLFSLQAHVLPQHRTDYFPSDHTVFLRESSNQQLRQYIHNYGLVIRSSVKRAKDRSVVATRPIWSYMGFCRTVSPTTQTLPTPPPVLQIAPSMPPSTKQPTILPHLKRRTPHKLLNNKQSLLRTRSPAVPTFDPPIPVMPSQLHQRPLTFFPLGHNPELKESTHSRRRRLSRRVGNTDTHTLEAPIPHHHLMAPPHSSNTGQRHHSSIVPLHPNHTKRRPLSRSRAGLRADTAQMD